MVPSAWAHIGAIGILSAVIKWAPARVSSERTMRTNLKSRQISKKAIVLKGSRTSADRNVHRMHHRDDNLKVLQWKAFRLSACQVETFNANKRLHWYGFIKIENKKLCYHNKPKHFPEFSKMRCSSHLWHSRSWKANKQNSKQISEQMKCSNLKNFKFFNKKST